MGAKWDKVPRKRVKGYTNKAGKKVKGYLRRRPDPKFKTGGKPLARSEIVGFGVSLYRRRDDKTFLGKWSKAALDEALTEIARVSGGRVELGDSVWRGRVRTKRGYTIGQAQADLLDVEDTAMFGGRIAIGVYLVHGSRTVFVPISLAWQSITEAAINGSREMLAMIRKYLPELDEASDDDEYEGPSYDVEPMTVRDYADAKGVSTSTVYRWISKKKIDADYDGKRLMVTPYAD